MYKVLCKWKQQPLKKGNIIMMNETFFHYKYKKTLHSEYGEVPINVPCNRWSILTKVDMQI